MDAQTPRIRGHRLEGGGSPHSREGHLIAYQLGGHGYAKCECGQLSPQSYPTGQQRRLWHAGHKELLTHQDFQCELVRLLGDAGLLADDGTLSATVDEVAAALSSLRGGRLMARCKHGIALDDLCQYASILSNTNLSTVVDALAFNGTVSVDEEAVKRGARRLDPQAWLNDENWASRRPARKRAKRMVREVLSGLLDPDD